ncbi:tol-pal system-associated acyl-CoA thioesterase [Roseateles sp.]|uniref:tol-pal system-associated acyl-CoA thioesterase n=1 Tax=Roseateles sp. TaxID=1971397 RepID=UPI003930F436
MTQPAFTWPARVYWEDTDAGGVVFYANYLKFFERARTEWLRAAGGEQQRLRLEAGLIFVVSETVVRYLAPARLDDELTITVEPVELGRATLTVHQRALRGDQVLAESSIRVGCVNAHDFKPARIPASLLAALQRP